MPIPLKVLAKRISPENTVLLFGAGASIPSGAPSVAEIIQKLEVEMGEDSEGYSFAEFCSLYEIRKSRRDLISKVRNQFRNLRPTGGILNLPNYGWRSIFTTNYDELVEDCFKKKDKPFRVFATNFDFGDNTLPGTTPIFKLHGTIGVDVSDGHHSRIVLTTEDNDLVEDYREKLYDRLKNDLSSSDLIIVGYSLSDQDLKSVVRRAVRLKKSSHSSQSIYLLLYKKDENRALLFENQGIQIAFGGVDDFFLELTKTVANEKLVYSETLDLLSRFPVLTPTTTDIAHEASQPSKNFGAMYAGSSSRYPEIRANLTFERTATSSLVEKLKGEAKFVTILGSSGVGKTTLARQVALSLVDDGFIGWEHNSSRPFQVDEWRNISTKLKTEGSRAILLLDDANLYLPEVNSLVDLLCADENDFLKLIITSANNNWKPRVKSSNITKYGITHYLKKLDNSEISRLLNLVENSKDVSKLVDKSFRGFTLHEKKRRLSERCNSDFFVCLKNIFANDSFDVIVLKEYAAISDDFQKIYKYICALESFGVVVHRQLVIRLLHISAQDLTNVLDNLDGLIEEFDIDRVDSIYGWRGRHPVISEIITNYKFTIPEDILELLRSVVKTISPTYDVEIRTLRQLCSFDSGIRRIPNIDDQNELLRTMISTAPMERVPRHRLISNLIRQGEFTAAETEIRVFENDLKLDGPVRRHKVRLIMERAISTAGLLLEDKLKLLSDAHDAVLRLVLANPYTPHTLRLFGDVNLEIFKLTGDYSYVDDVRSVMKRAEEEIGDSEITQALVRFDRRITPASEIAPEFVPEESDDERMSFDVDN